MDRRLGLRKWDAGRKCPIRTLNFTQQDSAGPQVISCMVDAQNENMLFRAKTKQAKVSHWSASQIDGPLRVLIGNAECFTFPVRRRKP